MQIEILHRPGSAVAKVDFDQGDEITTEAGSMVAMSSELNISTTTHKKKSGSVLKSFKRLLTGESIFLNHFSSSSGEDELFLTSTLPGDMFVKELKGEKIIVQSGSYVASEKKIDMDLSWQGFKSLFSGESIFWMNLTGYGKVILNSFGAVYEIEVDGEYIVDTGHIVAFDETLNFNISKAGSSWLHSFMGGEGFVCKFSGKGRVWCQSHNAIAFGRILGPKLKPRRG